MPTLYWWLIRIPVLLLIPSFLYDIEVLFLLVPLLFVHFTSGLKSVLNDYLHNKTSKTLLIFLTRLSGIEFLRYTLEVLV